MLNISSIIYYPLVIVQAYHFYPAAMLFCFPTVANAYRKNPSRIFALPCEISAKSKCVIFVFDLPDRLLGCAVHF